MMRMELARGAGGACSDRGCEFGWGGGRLKVRIVWAEALVVQFGEVLKRKEKKRKEKKRKETEKKRNREEKSREEREKGIRGWPVLEEGITRCGGRGHAL